LNEKVEPKNKVKRLKNNIILFISSTNDSLFNHFDFSNWLDYICLNNDNSSGYKFELITFLSKSHLISNFISLNAMQNNKQVIEWSIEWINKNINDKWFINLNSLKRIYGQINWINNGENDEIGIMFIKSNFKNENSTFNFVILSTPPAVSSQISPKFLNDSTNLNLSLLSSFSDFEFIDNNKVLFQLHHNFISKFNNFISNIYKIAN
jgi:hypothetical protein